MSETPRTHIVPPELIDAAATQAEMLALTLLRKAQARLDADTHRSLATPIISEAQRDSLRKTGAELKELVTAIRAGNMVEPDALLNRAYASVKPDEYIPDNLDMNRDRENVFTALGGQYRVIPSEALVENLARLMQHLDVTKDAQVSAIMQTSATIHAADHGGPSLRA